VQGHTTPSLSSVVRASEEAHYLGVPGHLGDRLDIAGLPFPQEEALRFNPRHVGQRHGPPIVAATLKSLMRQRRPCSIIAALFAGQRVSDGGNAL
jgi:hypothetical protein